MKVRTIVGGAIIFGAGVVAGAAEVGREAMVSMKRYGYDSTMTWVTGDERTSYRAKTLELLPMMPRWLGSLWLKAGTKDIVIQKVSLDRVEN